MAERLPRSLDGRRQLRDAARPHRRSHRLLRAPERCDDAHGHHRCLGAEWGAVEREHPAATPARLGAAPLQLVHTVLHLAARPAHAVRGGQPRAPDDRSRHHLDGGQWRTRGSAERGSIDRSDRSAHDAHGVPARRRYVGRRHRDGARLAHHRRRRELATYRRRPPPQMGEPRHAICPPHRHLLRELHRLPRGRHASLRLRLERYRPYLALHRGEFADARGERHKGGSARRGPALCGHRSGRLRLARPRHALGITQRHVALDSRAGSHDPVARTGVGDRDARPRCMDPRSRADPRSRDRDHAAATLPDPQRDARLLPVGDGARRSSRAQCGAHPTRECNGRSRDGDGQRLHRHGHPPLASDHHKGREHAHVGSAS